jgi:hypothetical protein
MKMEPCLKRRVEAANGEDLTMKKVLLVSFASVLMLSVGAQAQTEAFGNKDRTQVRRTSVLQDRQMAAREYRRQHRRRIVRNEDYAPEPWKYTVGGYEW